MKRNGTGKISQFKYGCNKIERTILKNKPNDTYTNAIQIKSILSKNLNSEIFE